VQGADEVVALLGRFEAVEWRYDGLGGKAIAWTKERGNTNDDPSVLAYVVGSDERLVAACPGNDAYSAPAFATWLREQAGAWEREHPPTRVPFVRAEVARTEDGVRCPAFDEAKESGRKVMLFFGRERRPDDERDEKKQVEATLAFVKKQLQSERAAKRAEGWVLLRFDLANEDHAAFARALGVTEAPAMLMANPPDEPPADLTAKLRSGSLAYWLNK
jgi:hypothetical protein